MKKITLATVKAFVKKNDGKIFVNVKSAFNGMTDGVDSVNSGFKQAQTDKNLDHTLGIEGAWFVGQSRDYFSRYENNTFVGYDIYNCCGRFILAVTK